MAIDKNFKSTYAKLKHLIILNMDIDPKSFSRGFPLLVLKPSDY